MSLSSFILLYQYVGRSVIIALTGFQDFLEKGLTDWQTYCYIDCIREKQPAEVAAREPLEKP